jgi:bacterioferritin
MAVSILNEELEHENDIEDWLTDLSRMKEEWKKIRIGTPNPNLKSMISE